MLTETPFARQQVEALIRAIRPWDELEENHKSDALKWISSDQAIFRIKGPDIPNKHLVSYFLIVDPTHRKILLTEHKNAGLWLPTGGHIEINEHPAETVKRECMEEVGIPANFLFKEPFFITQLVTVGLTAGHTDVSLWYVLKADSREELSFDREEFHSIQWFSYDSIPFEKADPHLKRVMEKLSSAFRAN
jgi:8-oxo-dGTP pyrophosphatase MutT (NUDIX family)